VDQGLDVRRRRVLGMALHEILQQQGTGVCGSPFGDGRSSSGCAMNVLLWVFCLAPRQQYRAGAERL
jgi:hypothetical protein